MSKRLGEVIAVVAVVVVVGFALAIVAGLGWNAVQWVWS